MTPTGNISTATTAPHDECGRLIDMLTRQRDLYRSLGGLSEKQQTIIAEGQTEQLLAVLSERQMIVDQLTQTNDAIAPLRGRMSEIAEAAPNDQREHLRGLVAEVQSLLESIIQRDEADRQTLESSKARVNQEIAKVNTAPAAINAYRANAYAKTAVRPPAARFTDSRG